MDTGTIRQIRERAIFGYHELRPRYGPVDIDRKVVDDWKRLARDLQTVHVERYREERPIAGEENMARVDVARRYAVLDQHPLLAGLERMNHDVVAPNCIQRCCVENSFTAQQSLRPKV